MHAWLAAHDTSLDPEDAGIVLLLKSNITVRNNLGKLPMDLVDPSKRPELYRWLKMAAEDSERFLEEMRNWFKTNNVN